MKGLAVSYLLDQMVLALLFCPELRQDPVVRPIQAGQGYSVQVFPVVLGLLWVQGAHRVQVVLADQEVRGFLDLPVKRT